MSALPAASSLTLSPELALPAPTASGRGEKAAREFEAHLLGQLLGSLQKTMASIPGQQDAPGQDDYCYLATEALGGALADAGGIGIARLITRHLEHTKVAGDPGKQPREKALNAG